MHIDNILMWVIIAVVIAAVLAVAIVGIVKVCKLKPEERKKVLLTFVKGIVAMAEKEIGSGHGDEKFKEVEEYFHKHAGWFIKTLLMLSGKNTLKDLIELALQEVKEAFEKK